MVHRALESLRDVEPLTVPIYETTTYVFDSAEQVSDYNAGKTNNACTRATKTRPSGSSSGRLRIWRAPKARCCSRAARPRR